MKLYEILNEITLIEQEIDKSAEENYGIVPEELLKKLDESELQLDEKLEGLLNVLDNKKAYSEAIRAEKSKLDSKLKTNERAIENLKFFISHIVGVGNKRTVGARKISWRKSESLEVFDESKVPNTFIRLEPKVNKNDLKDFIKSGGEVEGVTIKEKNNIQIK